MKKALKRHGSPEAITTDGLRSYRAAMNELYRLKLELAAELPSLHSQPPVSKLLISVSTKPAAAHLALSNTGDKPKEVGIDLRWLGLSRPVSVRDLRTGRDGGARPAESSPQSPRTVRNY